MLVARQSSGSPKNKRDQKIDVKKFMDDRWEVTGDGDMRMKKQNVREPRARSGSPASSRGAEYWPHFRGGSHSASGKQQEADRQSNASKWTDWDVVQKKNLFESPSSDERGSTASASGSTRQGYSANWQGGWGSSRDREDSYSDGGRAVSEYQGYARRNWDNNSWKRPYSGGYSQRDKQSAAPYHYEGQFSWHKSGAQSESGRSSRTDRTQSSFQKVEPERWSGSERQSWQMWSPAEYREEEEECSRERCIHSRDSGMDH